MHNASGTWEGDFKPSSETFSIGGKTYTFHEFAPGLVYDTLGGVSPRTVSLFWSDPLGSATNDYQLAIVDENNDVVRHSDTTIDGSSDPYQSLYGVLPGDRIAILQGPNAQPRFLHLATNRGRLSISTDGTTSGHHASGAANAFGVAQIDAREYQTAPGFVAGTSVHVRDSSSDGPRRIFYTSGGFPITQDLTSSGGLLLRKPDITAASCVTTDVPGFDPFCGTSAAAPHAAAIAALLLSARPGLSPGQVRSILTHSTLDIETAGWDDASGYGIVMPGPVLAAPDPVLQVEVLTRFPRSRINYITAGPDGAMWYTTHDNKIGRIPIDATAADPRITEYPIPTPGDTGMIVAGPDGALWFMEADGHKIGRIPLTATVARTGIREYALSSEAGKLIAGPDGAIWFIEAGNKIGRLAVTASPSNPNITEYPIPTIYGEETDVAGIAFGPDGALWFTEYLSNKIGRMLPTTNPSHPDITEYPLVAQAEVHPGLIAAGPDRAMWFTERAAHTSVGRIPVTAIPGRRSDITEYPIAQNTFGSFSLLGIVAGADGALWFNEQNTGNFGRISTAGMVQEYPEPFTGPDVGIAAGPTGDIWLTTPRGITRARYPQP
jgi:streptogramin lyase